MIQAGFYSVEILVGMTILILVVTLIAGYFKYNLKAAKKSDSFFISTELASSYLEKSKRELTNPDTLKLLLDSVGASAYARTAMEAVQGKDYQVTLKYQRVSPASDLMKVKATVRWDGTKTNVLGTVFPFTP